MPGKIISLLSKVNPALPTVNHLMDQDGFLIGWQGPNGAITILPASNNSAVAAGVEDGITASTTQTQAGGTELNYRNYRVGTANVNDAITLPRGIPGMRMTIQNATAVTIGVFPALGDKINAVAANAVRTMVTLTTYEFICTTFGQWITTPTVPS